MASPTMVSPTRRPVTQRPSQRAGRRRQRGPWPPLASTPLQCQHPRRRSVANRQDLCPAIEPPIPPPPPPTPPPPPLGRCTVRQRPAAGSGRAAWETGQGRRFHAFNAQGKDADDTWNSTVVWNRLLLTSGRTIQLYLAPKQSVIANLSLAATLSVGLLARSQDWYSASYRSSTALHYSLRMH